MSRTFADVHAALVAMPYTKEPVVWPVSPGRRWVASA